MPDNKPKIIRHPGRNITVPFKPHIPQHQILGVEPREFNGAIVSPDTQIAKPEPPDPNNPRMRKAFIAANIPSVTINRGPVPNVGNNMEHSWSSIDGQIVDDLTGMEVDPEHTMIDNNEEMTLDALEYKNGPTATYLQSQSSQTQLQMHPPIMVEGEATSHSPEDTEDLPRILAELDEDSYLLLVSGVPICSGPKEEIEDQARALVFGEHEICDGNPFAPEEIVILRRVKVKMGLFLE